MQVLSFSEVRERSLRIDDSHSLVYRIDDPLLLILACRYHYDR